ncbi:MAG: hypothetical protein H6742_08630 [Alphaproteobacteria bacterium]|nr:hypothetical protein [Alphaproteobacteria bacterium]
MVTPPPTTVEVADAEVLGPDPVAAEPVRIVPVVRVNGEVVPEAPGPVATRGGRPRVEAWAMNVGPPGRPECLWPVEADGSPCRSVSMGPVVLDDAQAARVEAWLGDSATFGEPLSSCFIPHHGITWRDADGVVTRQVSVCVSCENLRATDAVPGLPADPGHQGFSAQGRVAFVGLCEELGLPVCEGVEY